eukprot:TRINITY_DN2675_c0_g1_i3.p1 TRINITY_DN2675_c0_g1~~TRINITY_DN2675_c0_g1_i3.p1  ORF type:complete len:730 (-),score=189.88 TRINITY_DN2675_c0_g1_i3:24-2213(-)
MKLYSTTGVLGTLSFVGAAGVILSYFSVAELRRHPSKLVFLMSMCDLGFSLRFMITGVIPGSSKLEDSHIPCLLQALSLQFFGLASLSWNGIISLNLIINLNHPFINTSAYVKFYHLFVWGIASLSTILLGIFHHQIGPSGDGTCWIQDADSPLRLMLFVPLVIYFVLSMSALGVCFLRTREALASASAEEESANNMYAFDEASRRGMILRMASYVGVFLLCWSGPVVHRSIQFLQGTEDSVENPSALQYWDALGVSVQGFFNAVVWLTNPTFFTSFKRFILHKVLPCLRQEQEEATRERHPLLHEVSAKLGDTRQDVQRMDQILRKNIITCLLMGIRVSVSRGEHDITMLDNNPHVTAPIYKQKRTYTYADMFENKRPDEVSPPGSPAMGLRDTGARSYFFHDYCPAVFESLRSLASISAEDYKSSMHPSKFLNALGMQKFSEGRGGSFFVFSPDRKYVLKTVSETESKLLLKILPRMHQHFTQNEHSLLVRFYGCHAVQTPRGDMIHVVVMSNVFDHPDERVHEPYDLKGSWIKRTSGPHHQEDPSRLGMDSDLKRHVRVTPQERKLFLEQISRDAKFLCGLNIMDYSLLLGFHFKIYPKLPSHEGLSIPPDSSSTHSSLHDVTKSTSLETFTLPHQPRDESMRSFAEAGSPSQGPSFGRLESPDGLEVYYCGMIDVLQLYDKQKKMERFFKVYLLRKDPHGVSVIGPQVYYERFMRAMERLLVAET